MGTTRVACIKASSPCHSPQQPRLPATHELQRPCERGRARAEKKKRPAHDVKRAGAGLLARHCDERVQRIPPPPPCPRLSPRSPSYSSERGFGPRRVPACRLDAVAAPGPPKNRHELVLRGPLGAWLWSSRVDARMNDRRPFNLGGQLVFLSRITQLESILRRTREL